MQSTWSILLPDGEFLDTPANFELQFELNNQVFSTGDTSVLPGSFSFPIEVPLTDRMRQQLNHPDRVDNASRFREIKGVWACINSNQLFYGDLKINSANNKTVRLTIISNPLSALKELNLNQLDLGVYDVGSTDWRTHMKDTALRPEDYNHAFFTVGSEDAYLNFNVYDTFTNAFSPFFATLFSLFLITPFIKVKYILKKMFETADGWTMVNEWQQNEIELERLYVFNNIDARVKITEDPSVLGYKETFSLDKFVPEIKSSDFLKKIAAQWALGVFSNVFTRQITIKPLATVINSAVKQDWTGYQSSDPNIETPESFVGYFNYKNEALPDGLKTIEDAVFLRSFRDLSNLPAAEGYYYIESAKLLVYKEVSAPRLPLGRFHYGLRVGEGSNYAVNMEALFDELDRYRYHGEHTGYREVEGSSPVRHIWEEQKSPVALMLYRGLQNYIGIHGDYPVCGNHVWRDWTDFDLVPRVTISTNSVHGDFAKRSLNFNGEYGLYENFHKSWQNMLRNGKHVSQQFIMPITVLRQYAFDDKIRVGNMDFLLKKLRIQKLLANGTVLVEASMVTVI